MWIYILKNLACTGISEMHHRRGHMQHTSLLLYLFTINLESLWTYRQPTALSMFRWYGSRNQLIQLTEKHATCSRMYIEKIYKIKDYSTFRIYMLINFYKCTFPRIWIGTFGGKKKISWWAKVKQQWSTVNGSRDGWPQLEGSSRRPKRRAHQDVLKGGPY